MNLPTIENILFIGAVLLLLSVLLSKASGRLGLPALLVFMGIGMIAGSEGPGGIAFDNYALAQAVGIVALVFILFDGGISTSWRQVKPVAKDGILLSSVGVVINSIVMGLAVKFFLGLDWIESFLLGAIVSATDAAAVFGILRSRSASLKGNSQSLLEFESGSNDPMAVFLTVGLVALVSNPDRSLLGLLPSFAQQAIVGGAVGYGGGLVLAGIVNRIRLSFEGLYPVLTIASVLLIYSATALVGGSGFLAVYITGLVLGQREIIHKKSLMRFHSGIAWIMQIGMFLTLGLLLFPSHLVPVALPGSLLAFWLILVARPVSVFVSLVFSRFSTREKLLISWVGLRGATPIILATFPLLSGLENAEAMFNIVFFVVLFSVLIQGTSVPLIAKYLNLYDTSRNLSHPKIELSPSYVGRSRMIEVTIAQSSPAVGQQLFTLGLPDGVLIALVTRGDRYFVPRGDTILEADDSLTILTDQQKTKQIASIFEQ